MSDKVEVVEKKLDKTLKELKKLNPKLGKFLETVREDMKREKK